MVSTPGVFQRRFSSFGILVDFDWALYVVVSARVVDAAVRIERVRVLVLEVVWHLPLASMSAQIRLTSTLHTRANVSARR